MIDQATTSGGDDSSNETWPDRHACMAELAAVTGRNVTTKTLSAWIHKYKLRIPRTGPIKKAQLLEWARSELPPVGRPKTERGAAEDDLRSLYLQEQIRNLQAKNEVLEGTRLEAGAVSRGILAACASLKVILAGDLPVRFVEAIHGMSVEAAVDEIRRMQHEAVNRFCTEAHENTGTVPDGAA
jgi:hypothetical protein